MPLVSSHASQPWDGGRGTHLCGPPLRRCSEHGSSVARAAVAASQSGSSVSKMWCLLGMALSGSAKPLTSKAESYHVGARSANGPPGLTLAPTECRSHLQTVDESPVIKYLAPIPAVTSNTALETVIEHGVPASAVTYTSPVPVIEYVAPTPDATFDETAPASEHMAPAPDETFAAPAIQYVAPAPAVTDTKPE